MSLQFGLGLMSFGALLKYSNQTYYAIRSKQYGADATGVSKAKVYKGGFQSPMNRREALLILGLRETTAREPNAIKEQHSKLMISNHPDMNGSNYLASKINEAKDFLVKTSL